MVNAIKETAQPLDQEVAAPPSVTDISILPGFPEVGNPKDVSAALGIPESSVRHLCRMRELRAFKCGALWRIPKAWLLEFMDGGGCLAGQDASREGGERSWPTP